jgi:hypothetical protein
MYADDDPRENDDYAENLPDIELDEQPILMDEYGDEEDDPNEWA